ncbi:hypothetical protein AA0472_0235 [Acetobacter estunensis NRIC 0472]|nr:hypothetical protein AA0472_0235 [Acetobacter estunensis NRIC 0472]
MLLRQTKAVQKHHNTLRQAEINVLRSSATRLRHSRTQLTKRPTETASTENDDEIQQLKKKSKTIPLFPTRELRCVSPEDRG